MPESSGLLRWDPDQVRTLRRVGPLATEERTSSGRSFPTCVPGIRLSRRRLLAKPPKCQMLPVRSPSAVGVTWVNGGGPRCARSSHAGDESGHSGRHVHSWYPLMDDQGVPCGTFLNQAALCHRSTSPPATRGVAYRHLLLSRLSRSRWRIMLSHQPSREDGRTGKAPG